MKNLSRLIFVAISILPLVTYAQLPDYKTRIKILQAGINAKLRDISKQLYFETTDSVQKDNPHSWLWPLCAYFQAANEVEAIGLIPNAMQPVQSAIDQYYTNRFPQPAYQDYVTSERLSSRFYDDNQWLAITYLDAYRRTHKKDYLQKAEMINHFMLGGLDTVAGGGLYWKEGDKSTKNTCSNGPAILVLLELYKIGHQNKYLKTALQVYQWTNKCLQAPSGVYYDNIRTSDLKVGKATYTYNTGTMLQANVLLYQLTRKDAYLKEAQRIAKAGRRHFCRNGRLPARDYWFNAVLLRGYQALYHVDKNADWIYFFKQDADAVWAQDLDTDNLIGRKKSKSLIDQAAMIEIYARLESLKFK